MVDPTLVSSTNRFDGTLSESVVPHYTQPIAGALVEQMPSGITYAIFNLSGVTIKGGDNLSIDSIIPFNQCSGPREGLSSKAAKQAMLNTLQELATQPFFQALIKDGAVIAFLGAFEKDLGFALAEVAPNFMKALGASTVTQTIIRGIECPSVWDDAQKAHSIPALQANIRGLISGER